MAKLPSAVDLQRRPAPSETPGISVPALDTSGMAQAGRAIGQGIDSLAKGMQAKIALDTQADDFETRKRLLEFKLDTEMEFEQAKRTMQPGDSAEFAQSWTETYRKRAEKFVGRDDSNIPASQRGKIGLALKQQEMMLQERAQRYETQERDRAAIEGLETVLGRTRDYVSAKPVERDRWLQEGLELIDKSTLPVVDKYRLRANYQKEVDRAYGSSLADGVQTAEDLAKLRELIAPNAPDRRAEKLTLGSKQKPASGWAATNKEWAALGPFERAAAMALLEADGRNTDDARNALSAMINRSAREGEDLGSHVSRAIYQPTIEPAQEARLRSVLASSAHKELTAWAQRRAAGEEADPVAGATHFLAHEQTMLGLEAKEPQKYRSWRKWTGFDGKEYRGVKFRDKSHAFLSPDGELPVGADDPSAYRGPMQSLSLEERRAVFNRAEQRFNKLISDVDQRIKEQEGPALGGTPPPAGLLAVMDKRVRELNDPMLTARYRSMLDKAALARELQAAPPQAIAEIARRQREYITNNGATKEQEEQVKFMESAAETRRKQVNDDVMTFAGRVSLRVPMGDREPPEGLDPAQRAQWRNPVEEIKLESLDFAAPDIDARLTRRIQQATAVGRYYGQPPQLFTKIERDFMKDRLRDGGAPMLHVMGKIVAAARANGLKASDAVREFAGEDEEVAVLGTMVAEGANDRILKDAAEAFRLRKTEGVNFVSQVDKMQTKPDVSEFLGSMPLQPGAGDAILKVANAAYEYRHRRMGLTAFDANVHRQIVREVMGERTVDGTAYGGPGQQGTGWWDGKSQAKVIVPPRVRQDSFDRLLDAMTEADLDVVGRPVTQTGQEISMARLRKAEWQYVGEGKYRLQLGTSAGQPEIALLRPAKDNERVGPPFLFDLSAILGRLERRQPALFLGGSSQ